MEQNRGGNSNNRGQHHGGGYHRGGGGGGQRRNHNNNNRDGGGRRGAPRAGEERPKKEAILDLAKYRDQEIRVKFQGGRQVIGILKGYDQLMNLVLDDVKENLRDPEDGNILLDQTRDLGMVVVRGPLLLSLSPVAGNEVISNPFVQAE